jgi:primosomal protein N' (replication factor Y)
MIKNILEEYFIQQIELIFLVHHHRLTYCYEVQEKAYDAIKSNFVQKEVCLLHVTSSGKTEIYIN